MPETKSNLHEAICAECGKKCQVPFLPTADKPVYCEICFAKKRGQNRTDRKMYSAVCAKCGKTCQVSFQPTPGKPVYCNACFSQSRGANQPQRGSGDQLQQINAKLDKIMNALIEAKIIKPAKPEAKPIKAEIKKETKPAKVKKVPVKKAAKKKK